MPNISASAIQDVVSGKATFVAALPSVPTACPINNWSTILYKALTSIAIILGTANFTIKEATEASPNGLPVCMFSLRSSLIFSSPCLCILLFFYCIKGGCLL